MASREPFTCPLCECVPQKLCAVHPQQRLEEVSGLLGKHVAFHIKALSLLSFRLLPYNDEGEDIHENSSNLFEDMSMDIQHELSGSEQRMELSGDAELSESFEDIPVTDRHTNEAISIEDITVHTTPELADSELWTFLPAFDYLNKEQDQPRRRKTIADEHEERQAKRLQHIQAADSGSDSEHGPRAGGVDTVKIATNAFHRSGQLNAKQRDIAELLADAQRRLKSARLNFAEGMKVAKETRRDLDYTQKKLS